MLIKKTNCRTYRVDEALRLIERHGFASHLINRDAQDQNILVTLHQEFTPKGEEKVAFRRARGKWRGNWCGSSFRTNHESTMR